MTKLEKRLIAFSAAFALMFGVTQTVSAMHIAEGFLSPGWCIGWGAVCIPFLIAGVLRIKRTVFRHRKSLILLAMAGAYAFILSALKIPSINGSSSHPTGTGMAAILFGPAATAVLGLIVLLFQATLLAHGGLSTLGANTFSMAIAGPLVSWGIYKLCKKCRVNRLVSIFLAAGLGDLFTYCVTSFQLAFDHPSEAGGVMASAAEFLGVFAVTQVPLAIVEGLLTVVVMMGLEAYAKPELVESAADLGYLIASYDSYHSIHEPGKEQWITARFEDQTLYENAAVTDKNGEKESGFQGVGRKLNPVLSIPAVKSRMEEIMSNNLPFNSWFIDCDATGEIYDDYTPEHMTTQEQDLAARLERMSLIRDQYDFVIGSEGGNDFAASVIAFAHGIELPTFAWMDEDMKSNKDSEYYIGRYYNPSGGVAEHFSKRIPVKQQYRAVFLDPQYDIPLFKLVYHDSVITSYHWDWSTFKIQGATQDRMLREILYDVPPLYHLDQEQWEEYKEDISAHHKVWSAFSREAAEMEMTDFDYLEEDGLVQKTVYGEELTAVANFRDTSYLYEGNEIAPHSILIRENGREMVYTPSVNDNHQ